MPILWTSLVELILIHHFQPRAERPEGGYSFYLGLCALSDFLYVCHTRDLPYVCIGPIISSFILLSLFGLPDVHPIHPTTEWYCPAILYRWRSWKWVPAAGQPPLWTQSQLDNNGCNLWGCAGMAGQYHSPREHHMPCVWQGYRHHLIIMGCHLRLLERATSGVTKKGIFRVLL